MPSFGTTQKKKKKCSNVNFVFKCGSYFTLLLNFFKVTHSSYVKKEVRFETLFTFVLPFQDNLPLPSPLSQHVAFTVINTKGDKHD